MDLENRLLEGLSIYHPPLESFAKARAAVYQVRPNPADPAHQLIDEACERYLAGLVNELVPDDNSQDQAMIEQLQRREEILEHMRHIPEYELQLEDGTGLMFAILAWAAAQSFSRWGNKPWSLLVEMLLDQEWANVN